MNTNTSIPTVSNPQIPIFPIVRFTDFAELLHDRIHALLYHTEEINAKFTLITNFFDRSPEKLDEEQIIYAGAETQRRILEGFGECYEEQNISLDYNWAYLKNRPITEGTMTLKYIPLFKSGELSLKDIKTGLLSDYFRQYHESGKFVNSLQENEYPILSKYFNTEKNSKDGYISIPIIVFGTIDGVVHIIFEEKTTKVFENEEAVKRIIKQFAMAYENQLISWSVDIKDVNNISAIKIQQAKIDEEYVHKNPIMKELGLPKYYKISNNYYGKRIEDVSKLVKELDEAKQKIAKQQQVQAITTILIDSFAHNISAHSLTTLAWWFKERAEYISDPELRKFRLQIENNPLVLHYQMIQKTSKPLSRELAPLFRFLAEKATFWNAVGRKTNFSGQIISLFDVIWNDLIGNPLYLGSIANAEKVRKLHINLTFFEEEVVEDKTKPYINRKKIKKIVQNGKEIFLNDTLATINFQDFYKNTQNLGEDNLADMALSPFIEKGQFFDVLSEELKQYKAFFPGGVIGKHAFLTIIETEIRNIKHYKDDVAVMKKVQERGLILNLSIHKRYVNPNADNRNTLHQIYKIGISIKLPTEIGAQVIAERIENLEGDIVTADTFRPRLGGIYQDKICAAMLFNNEFASVQNRTEPRDAHYYPWVKSAVNPVHIDEKPREEVTDLEMSWRKYDKIKEDFTDIFDNFVAEQSKLNEHEANRIYFKKYIHLWSGNDLHYLQINENLEWENIARHKFVILLPNQEQSYQELKKIGIVRILQSPTKIDSGTNAYLQWLQIWSKGNRQSVIMFMERNTNAGRIVYENDSLSFQNLDMIRGEDIDTGKYYNKIQTEQGITLRIEHGGKMSYELDMSNYRSYGVFMRRFCQGKSLKDINNISTPDLCELYEALITRIAIFDDRAVQRIRVTTRLNHYANTLRCGFYNEEIAQWETIKKEGFEKYHFLVVHLTFIEKMKDSTGKAYGENRINEFINNEILVNTTISNLQDHFTLVITTGRGRVEWWERIKQTPDLVRITTYRPIESILSAVEDAMMINDDIDLKYNLVKVLIGS